MAWMFGSLLVLEVVLRLFLVTPSTRTTHPVRGPHHVAGARVVSSDEGYVVERLNSLGLFDDEPDPQPSRGRVLVLGDSHTQAQQVPRSSRTSEQAQQRLPGVDVINAGHTNWSPTDAIGFLEVWPDSLPVDLVVVQVAGNDLDQLERPRRTHVERDGDGWRVVRIAHVASTSLLARIVRGVSRHSSLATVVRRRLAVLSSIEKNRLRAKFDPAPARADVGEPVQGSSTRRLTGDNVARVRTALSALATDVEARVLLYVPDFHYRSDGLTSHHPDAAEVFRRAAAAEGWRFVDTSEAIRDGFARDRQPLHGFHNSVMGRGHLNAKGHAVVGAVLAETIDDVLPPIEP